MEVMEIIVYPLLPHSAENLANAGTCKFLSNWFEGRTELFSA